MTKRNLSIDERRLIPCSRGHSREDAFVYIGQSTGKPQLWCRQCADERLKRWRFRKRGNRQPWAPGRPRKVRQS